MHSLFFFYVYMVKDIRNMGFIAKLDFILYMSDDKFWVWRVFVMENINYL